MDQLSVVIVEQDATVERLDALTGYLRQELLELDVDDVRRQSAGEAPAGSRALDVDAIGGLIVALGRSTTGLRDVVAAIRRWLSRGDGVLRTVKIEIDGDRLELSQVSPADQDRLINIFVNRHTISEGSGERPA
jgi:hypothetical protein